MALLVVGSSGTPSVRRADAGPQQPAGSDLEERIARFTAGFGEHGGYRIPTTDERTTLSQAIAFVLDGRPEDARTRLATVGYTIETVTDSVSGRRYAEMADGLGESGRESRGWGRVYIDLDHPARWSVQVPHPLADARTELLGARVLRGAPGGILVIAGAHRNAGKDGAADMAHRRDSVFNAVIDELAHRSLPAIQLHGFANDSFPGRDAVVSTGAGDKARADAAQLSASLRREGLNVCTAYTERCRLSGTENEQGQLAAGKDLRFLHIELNKTVRGDDETLDRAAASITQLTDSWYKL
ncbi:hypothetical protein [Streptomyces sp. G-G2]|uniref:hypothetical protein n=1 Tax=Streptomyces sp. G-G2 TaxID=3046201 RepID=UPI0024B9CD18|nr:hypothetical protein [Streptomyces sp. G-G2]MDJ0383559.1 hypothetical protein [Streptomyces sp. G-G2]